LKRHNLLALLLVTQLRSGAPGQQPSRKPVGPPPQQQLPSPESQKPDAVDVVRITTNLVQVDAVVTDKNGKVVTDLRPEELQIFEEGKEQKITSFSYVVSETPVAEDRPARTAAPDKNAPPVPTAPLKRQNIRRTIALVVDDLGLSFESTHYVRRALKKFVDDQMQPGDLVAIIRTGSGMGALQQFTSDKRQLYAAIERVKYNLNGRANVGAFSPTESPSEGQMGPNIDKANEDLDQFREELFTVGSLGALSYVVKGLRELPGRKSVLFISDGVKIFQTGDPNRNLRIRERLSRLVDEAGRASVVIYTMNGAGLQTTGLNASDSTSGSIATGPPNLLQILQSRSNLLSDQQSGLEFLACQTGGIAIKNYNDLSLGILKVLEDQKGYYLIGYRPDQSTFDARTGARKFHHLTLRVKRPGKFSVRMRDGFYGVTDQQRPGPRSRTQQLFGALTSPFGATGVHLQLTSLFGDDAKAGSFMRAMLHVDARDLSFTDEPKGMHKSVFDLLAITFGDNGAAIDQDGRTYTLVMSDQSYKKALRQGFVYNVLVPIKKPGAYQLRMALRDTNTERIGSVTQFIEVPDVKKNRLTLSGVILKGVAPQIGADQAKEGRVASSEGAEETNPESSAAVRHFSPGMMIEYGYEIYNARIDKPTNRPQLVTQVRLFLDGKLIYSGKETPLDTADQIDLKRLVTGDAIQLTSRLAPGEYVLQIVVKDMLVSGTYGTASQWIDFEIVK
jgi:VWFA-related protein